MNRTHNATCHDPILAIATEIATASWRSIGRWNFAGNSSRQALNCCHPGRRRIEASTASFRRDASFVMRPFKPEQEMPDMTQPQMSLALMGLSVVCEPLREQLGPVLPHEIMCSHPI